jgi:hypothetical protein
MTGGGRKRVHLAAQRYRRTIAISLDIDDQPALKFGLFPFRNRVAPFGNVLLRDLAFEIVSEVVAT